MQNSSFTTFVRRWMWVILPGIIVCGGMTYVISLFVPPVYQANATLLISFGTSGSSYENTSASLEAVPTYTRVVSSPDVLKPVLAVHKGLTLQMLNDMLSVQAITNTQLITLSIENSDPSLAAQLANEICTSFEQFAAVQLPIKVQTLPAEIPSLPVRPRPLLNAAIGALAGSGFIAALIIIFEWIDRLYGLEQIQALLEMEMLAVIVRQVRGHFFSHMVETSELAEKYRTICARLQASQAASGLKMLMVTSARPGEGKSMVATNIALFLAREGKRVLLVDANVYSATLHKYFYLHNQVGFANIFEENWRQSVSELYGQATSIATLQVMSAGKVPSNFAKLLRSPRAGKFMEQFKKAPFDYIIFDAPALLSDPDATLLASLIPTTLVVIDASRRSRRELLHVRQLLHKADTSILGIIINNSPWLEDKDLLYTQRQQSSKTQSMNDLTNKSTMQEVEGDLSTQPTTARPAISRFAIRQSRLFMQPVIKQTENTLTTS